MFFYFIAALIAERFNFRNLYAVGGYESKYIRRTNRKEFSVFVIEPWISLHTNRLGSHTNALRRVPPPHLEHISTLLIISLHKKNNKKQPFPIYQEIANLRLSIVKNICFICWSCKMILKI